MFGDLMRSITCASCALLVATLSTSASAQPLCSTGFDGDAILNAPTVVNTYYPPSQAEQTLTAGDTTIPVGSPLGAFGPIQAGDVLMIVQMQATTIDSGPGINQNDPYGDGTGGNDRAGFLTGGFTAGFYEFVTALGAVSGGQVTVQGQGGGGGLVNTYVASQTVTDSQGVRSFQIVRVPQYQSITLGAGGIVRALDWDGNLGGVIAFFVADLLTIDSGGVDVTEAGFRGGAANSQDDNDEFGELGAPGFKGEGIAGTPLEMFDSGLDLFINRAADGYPVAGNGAGRRGVGRARQRRRQLALVRRRRRRWRRRLWFRRRRRPRDRRRGRQSVRPRCGPGDGTW